MEDHMRAIAVISFLTALCIVAAVSLPATVCADTRPDAHAPIGVMGEHIHEAGEWMLSYRFMFMRMDGNRDGTSSVSTARVLQDFPVTPTDMDMQLHMIGAMYAPTDSLTLMGMLPILDLSMDHVTRMGRRFTTTATGPGDLRLTALYNVYRNHMHSVLLNLGLSTPTGSINERDDTPAGKDQKLPYPMQLGSGTWDLLPGVTYLGQTEHWSWGFQPMGTLRLGTNSEDYRLGRRVDMSLWGARKVTEWLSASLRLGTSIWFNIHGNDPELNPNMVPTADPDRRGGERLDLLFGVNGSAPHGVLEGARLAIEGGLPIYQSLDGPQLETDWLLTIGVQWAFG
jgi:hypothetical protein